MIITITGSLGSGKSTIAKLLAEKLNYKHYSTGDFMREMATERSMTLLELSKAAENDKSIDKALDDRQVDIGKRENNFVIDARLGWYFIPHAVKIFLDVKDEAAAKRIFDARRPDEKYNTTLEKTLENIKTRRESEKKRYFEYYSVDYYDKKNYDFVLDTTKINVEQVLGKVYDFVKKYETKKSKISKNK
jgi:CMP/dCMP kinase